MEEGKYQTNFLLCTNLSFFLSESYQLLIITKLSASKPSRRREIFAQIINLGMSLKLVGKVSTYMSPLNVRQDLRLKRYSFAG